MYLAVHKARFICPTCRGLVQDVVVTAVQTVFTASAQALHRGYGHTVVLTGTQWSVRCQDDRALSPIGLMKTADDLLVNREPGPAAVAAVAQKVGGKEAASSKGKG